MHDLCAPARRVDARALDDDVLVQRASLGDDHAAGILLERFRPVLTRVATARLASGGVFDRDLAEELASEAILRLLRCLRAGGVHSAFGALAWTTVVNLVLSEFRTRKRRPCAVGLPEALPCRVDATDRDLAVIAESLLEELSDRDRQALGLYYLRDQDWLEVAEAMGVRRNTAEVAGKRARVRARSILEGRGYSSNLLFSREAAASEVYLEAG